MNEYLIDLMIIEADAREDFAEWESEQAFLEEVSIPAIPSDEELMQMAIEFIGWGV